jgi:hypothetical protein
MWLEGLGKFKKFNDFIGNGTRDLPACGIAPQLAMLTHASLRLRESVRSLIHVVTTVPLTRRPCHQIFLLPNPSSRTVALGLSQPLTEMSTRNLPGDKRAPSS